ncbi:PilN domain-containing protein [Chitinispirillales bacterium ANBcel5]|uniref:PilN domain-containing protein n=1 Tax=Cellulosispirillum alkaliphilum TaxID=3039283 RepID=UPI002A525E12|nr:PilN domain-containing protein [Chitinispirillales bacterium ANBcel5]
MHSGPQKKCKKITGVVPTESLNFISVTLIRTSSSQWKVKSIKEWQSANRVKPQLFLSNGAMLGVTTHWLNNTTGAAQDLIFTPYDSAVKAATSPVHNQAFIKALSGTIIDLVTDDFYLISIPQTFCKACKESFISLHFNKGILKAGIVINNKLEGVFNLSCHTTEEVFGNFARIERYWSHKLNRNDFPNTCVTIGSNLNDFHLNSKNTLSADIPKELIESSDALKAAGVAFSRTGEAPTFGIAKEDQYSTFRPLAQKIAVCLLILALLFSVTPRVLTIYSSHQLSEKQRLYNSILKEDQDIRDLTEKSEKLSQEILSFKQTYSRRTNWSRLLQALGESRPDDLFIERLGSEPIGGSDDRIRIAIGGWAHSETSVTRFIANLQSLTFIHGISLSSLERDAEEREICRYRIICTLDLFEK